MSALAHVATHSKTNFGKYYSSFMPGLKQIIAGCTTKETRALRGKSIECMSLIGAAVSEGGQGELFEADGAELMSLVLTSLSSQSMDSDDPTQAWPLTLTPTLISTNSPRPSPRL